MSAARAIDPASADAFLDLYDEALPSVYGYLLRRCGDVPGAQDLASETFLAAVSEINSGRDPHELSVGWLIGIARHKLIDHWRKQEREQRNLTAVASLPVEANDPWDEILDGAVARDTLARLAGAHRTVLTLRYVDDLPVPQVAAILERSLHATESLLVRARSAFRDAYESTMGGGL